QRRISARGHADAGHVVVEPRAQAVGAVAGGGDPLRGVRGDLGGRAVGPAAVVVVGGVEDHRRVGVVLHDDRVGGVVLGGHGLGGAGAEDRDPDGGAREGRGGGGGEGDAGGGAG